MYSSLFWELRDERNLYEAYTYEVWSLWSLYLCFCASEKQTLNFTPQQNSADDLLLLLIVIQNS